MNNKERKQDDSEVVDVDKEEEEEEEEVQEEEEEEVDLNALRNKLKNLGWMFAIDIEFSNYFFF